MFAVAQARGIARSTRETVTNSVRVFMYDDPIIHIGIAIGIGRCPYIHLHAGTGSIGRCREIRIVRTTRILCIGDDVIVAGTASSLVVVLEISTRFIESVHIGQIMNDIIPIEKIYDRRFLIIRGGIGR